MESAMKTKRRDKAKILHDRDRSCFTFKGTWSKGSKTTTSSKLRYMRNHHMDHKNSSVNLCK